MPAPNLSELAGRLNAALAGMTASFHQFGVTVRRSFDPAATDGRWLRDLGETMAQVADRLDAELAEAEAAIEPSDAELGQRVDLARDQGRIRGGRVYASTPVDLAAQWRAQVAAEYRADPDRDVYHSVFNLDSAHAALAEWEQRKADARARRNPPDILDRIDEDTLCTWCAGTLDGSVSDSFCGQACQTAWYAQSVDQLPAAPDPWQTWADQSPYGDESMAAEQPVRDMLDETVTPF